MVTYAEHDSDDAEDDGEEARVACSFECTYLNLLKQES